MHTAPAYNAAIEAGVSTDSLEPPAMMPELLGIYDDFWELSTDRQIGMAAGPIPAASIARHTAGWPYDVAWMFRICIRKMDDAYRAKPDDKPADATGSDNPARDAFRGMKGAKR